MTKHHLKLAQWLLPAWCRSYPRAHALQDLVAGVVVTVLVLPQSLAYALLAGLPPQAGLYASIVPVMVYAWVGSSMTQAIGPVAITAIMTFSLLSPLASAGSVAYVGLAAWLALFTGLLVCAFGLLRLGYLASLLSRPVVGGFIAGSAVLILISQIRPLLGMYNPTTVALGIGGMLTLWIGRAGWAWALRRWQVPPERTQLMVGLVPLAVVVVSTLAVVAWDLDRAHGVAVVGQVAVGLPELAWGLPDGATLQLLAGPALALAFISTVQNISMAQALALRRRERTDANREMLGLGAANVAAAFFGGMPVGGGTSRSAVNVASGAQSPLASLVSAVCMLGIVLAGTEWFARIPLATLAASIMVSAASMVDSQQLRRAWRYDRADAMAYLGTALGVLVLGLQGGIVLGVGLSLATFLFRASTPHIAVVGRIAGTEHFRNVDRHGVQTLDGVLFLRIDESLFFGNFQAVESRLMAEIAKLPDVHAVVLILSAVNRVDLTAADALAEWQQDLQGRGIALHLAEVKGPVQDRLQSTALWRQLQGKVYLSANAAYDDLMPH